MKLNKSKGKVHPSPAPPPSSSSSSLSLSSSVDPVSALNLLLPAAILTLISVLSLQDREVLAYMITRSLKSATATTTPDGRTTNNTNRKRKPKKSAAAPHKSPCFDCGCFDCYTTYWFRWDSSPHRELIHQAIEAFEDHLAAAEHTSKTTSSRARRRDKDKKSSPIPVAAAPEDRPQVVEVQADSPEINVPEVVGSGSSSPESIAGVESTESRGEEDEVSGGYKQQQQHKGLARKVLPDVIGLLNSRLWNLWGPNV